MYVGEAFNLPVLNKGLTVRNCSNLASPTNTPSSGFQIDEGWGNRETVKANERARARETEILRVGKGERERWAGQRTRGNESSVVRRTIQGTKLCYARPDVDGFMNIESKSMQM